jgi:hypothetical protein
MTARLAMPVDQQALYDMARDMYAEGPGFHGRQPDWQKIHQQQWSAIMDGRCFVVGPEGAPHAVLIGVVTSQWWSSELEARDMMLYVAPHRRGSPDFLRLIRAYEDWAADQGVHRVNLGISSGFQHETTAMMLMRLDYAPMAESFAKSLDCGP